MRSAQMASHSAFVQIQLIKMKLLSAPALLMGTVLSFLFLSFSRCCRGENNVEWCIVSSWLRLTVVLKSCPRFTVDSVSWCRWSCGVSGNGVRGWGGGGGQAGSLGVLQFPGTFRLVSGERTLRIF